MLVAYDVSTESQAGRARLRRVARACLDFGQRVQYSVFECDLNAGEKVQMESKLTEIIDQTLDQVMFVNLGSAQGRGDWEIAALGRPYTKMAAPCYVF